MSTSSEIIDSELAARGTADITAADAFRAWEYAERHATPCVAVLRMLPPAPGTHRPPLLSELDETGEPGEPGGTDEPTQAEMPWAGLSQDDLAAYIVEEVAGQVAAELHLPSEIDRRRPLTEAGLDSVMALIIRRRLEQHFRISLPTTLLWNQPTVDAISGLIAELLSPTAA
jgi:6-methylsalicylic acid synthase